jgi:hypothetical protein
MPDPPDPERELLTAITVELDIVTSPSIAWPEAVVPVPIPEPAALIGDVTEETIVEFEIVIKSTIVLPDPDP